MLVTSDGEPVGCGRMLADGHIGRMAVLKDFLRTFDVSSIINLKNPF